MVLLKKKEKEKKTETVSVFFLCSSAFYHLCKKRIKHMSVLTKRFEFLDGNFNLCRSSVRVPLALRLLAGRLPWC